MKVQYLNPPRPDQIDLAQPIDWQHPQARGLVAYYPLWLGASVLDSARDRAFGRYPVNESLSYPSITGDGTFGRAVLFNGSSSSLVHSAAFVNRGCTLSAWIYPTNATAAHSIVTVGNTLLSGQVMSLRARGDVSGDPLQMAAYDGITLTSSNSSTGYSLNSWQLATGVLNANGSSAVYRNGASKGTHAAAVNALEFLNSTAIGYQNNDATLQRYFAGRMGEVRVYGRVLSDAEVYNLWHPARRWGMLRTLTGRRVFYVPAAGPSFKPYWIRRQSQLIAGGVN